MSNYIVLVKQVPDISQISDNVFNPETGTLMRSKLASVINELDTHALAIAGHMRQVEGTGKIIAVTMGPPAAADVLRYALARGADKAVLVTDRAFGGADTYATANTLAFAIRKIAAELIGNNDYFVISGMQSIDGDTAQVPPQIAAQLCIPCISYVTGVELKNDHFEFTRIVSGGSETVRPLSSPALITVAKYPDVLYASLSSTRRANKTELIQWGLSDINPSSFGLAGSKTQVIKVFAPPKSQRKCIKLETAGDLTRAIAENIKASGHVLAAIPSNQGHAVGALPKLNLALGLKEFWVIGEMAGEKASDATFELIAKARSLADAAGAKVCAVMCLADKSYDANELIYAGADHVHAIIDPLLKTDDTAGHTKAISKLISGHWPQIVFFAATPFGRTLAPMVSYGLHCGLTADCTAFDIRLEGDNCILLQTRPALGGNVMATICSKNCQTQMATARPGVFKRLAADMSRKGQISEFVPSLALSDLSVEIIRSEIGADSNKFARKKIIISGGKGLKNRENFTALTQSLSAAVEKALGIKPEIGASRSAVEHGFAPRSSQVGQTGTSVAPRIYIAMGISGAIQHMIGIANSETIIAINSDPAAPICRASDYYYIGCAEEIVPQMVKELEKLKTNV